MEAVLRAGLRGSNAAGGSPLSWAQTPSPTTG